MRILIFGDKGYISNSLFFDKEKKFDVILLNKREVNQKKKFNKKVDLIIHTLGANKFNSQKKSVTTFKNKQKITIDLINFAKKNKIKKIIYLSSINIYQNNKKNLNLKDPYSNAHIAAENILKKNSNNHLKILILRASHFFGIRDVINSKGKFLSVGNKFIKCALNKQIFILNNIDAKINILPLNYFISRISKLLSFKGNFVRKDIFFLEVSLKVFLKYISDFIQLKTGISPVIHLSNGEILRQKRTNYLKKINHKKKFFLNKEIENTINFIKINYS